MLNKAGTCIKSCVCAITTTQTTRRCLRLDMLIYITLVMKTHLFHEKEQNQKAEMNESTKYQIEWSVSYKALPCFHFSTFSYSILVFITAGLMQFP